jgi:hypothetical protein
VNKTTVDRYMDGFRRTDRAQILSRLTDDVHAGSPEPGAQRNTDDACAVRSA